MITKFNRLARSFWYFRVKRETTLAGLQLDVTSGCNLRCKTCYFYKESSNLTEDMPIPDIRDLFADYSNRHVYQIWLFGGEPTLRPEVLDLACEYFPIVTVISNGQIKIHEKYNRIKIHVSIDGLEHENDFTRGAGSFNRIVSNYTGDKRVIFNLTITKKNVGSLPEIIKYVKKLKTAGIEFQLFSTSDTPSKYDEQLMLGEDDYDTAFTTLRKFNLDPNVFVTNAVIDSWMTSGLKKDCRLIEYIDCYSSDGSRKYCCTPGVKCEDCKMLPVHLLEAIDRKNDLLTKFKFAFWI